MKTNSAKAWFLAARPKTLTGAAAPVILALALAWSDTSKSSNIESGFQWIPALLCLLFALLMQVDANFINDYFDFKDGIDGAERLGPERACAQGWITPHAMKCGIGIVTVASSLVGLPTILWGGWQLITIGVLCILFAFLYTTLLSRIGLGDLLVLVFFGIVPVCTTYYIQLHTVTLSCFILSLGMGLVTDNLLIVNNYRDRDTDKAAGKHTLITAIGAKWGERLYLVLGIIGTQCSYIAVLLNEQNMHTANTALLVGYLAAHCNTWRMMVKINQGRELNKVLGQTAMGIFIYALLTSIALLI